MRIVALVIENVKQRRRERAEPDDRVDVVQRLAILSSAADGDLITRLQHRLLDRMRAQK